MLAPSLQHNRDSHAAQVRIYALRKPVVPLEDLADAICADPTLKPPLRVQARDVEGVRRGALALCSRRTQSLAL